MSRELLTVDKLIYENDSAGVKVYKGVFGQLQKPVAIKTITFSDSQFGNSLLREAMCLSSLNHPAILNIYDCFLQNLSAQQMSLTIVTDLMAGDLHEEIERRKATYAFWSEDELWEIMKTLICALSFAEKKGISHRDVKPQNIFVTGNIVKIGDFGSAASNLRPLSERWSLHGSPFYLAPELKHVYLRQIQSGPISEPYNPFKSDVYSLGLVLIEMANLDPPRALLAINELPAATSTIVNALAYPFLKPWVAAMLDSNPDNRPTFEQLEEYVMAAEEYQRRLIEPGSGIEDDASDLPYTRETSVGSRDELNCTVCGAPIKSADWRHPLPVYLRRYITESGSCCSKRCLERCVGAWPDILCVHCKGEITDFSLSENQEIPCGHNYHMTCFAQFIQANRIQSETDKKICCVCHNEREIRHKADPTNVKNRSVIYSESLLRGRRNR